MPKKSLFACRVFKEKQYKHLNLDFQIFFSIMIQKTALTGNWKTECHKQHWFVSLSKAYKKELLQALLLAPAGAFCAFITT